MARKAEIHIFLHNATQNGRKEIKIYINVKSCNKNVSDRVGFDNRYSQRFVFRNREDSVVQHN
ncbi:hypothetical protein CKA32_005261 [Geitlerinema sp. FC II]|nr:hypothetical protein CKA32_005261 [Geitlerinema sp. FC II]